RKRRTDNRLLIKCRYGGVFNPGAPIIYGFTEEVLYSALQRRLKRLAIGKRKVLGAAKNKRFLAEEVTYGNIRGQPHLLNTVAEPNVVTTPESVVRLRSVCAHRLADDAYAWPA